jgi:hydroxymethylbilane synthase
VGRAIKVGTRDNKRELAHTELVINKLQELHKSYRFEVIAIKTKGDRLTTAKEFRSATNLLFSKEIELALLKKKIDLAIHQVKHLPLKPTPDITLGAVLERNNPSDLFVGRTVASIDKLGPKYQIGIYNPLHHAYLHAYYPHLVTIESYGEIEVRLEKLMNPKLKLSGMICSAISIVHLQLRNNLSTQILPQDPFLPGAGQGAFAIQIREKDTHFSELLKPIHHPLTAVAIHTERAILRRWMGTVPLGIYAEATDDDLVRVTTSLIFPERKTRILETTIGAATDIESIAETMETMLKSRIESAP